MNVNFSRNFVALRRMKGYTQESLAEKCGVSRQAITKWENGSSLPDMYRLVELSEIFGVGLDDLVCGSFEEPKEDEIDYKALYYERMKEKSDIADIKRLLQVSLGGEDEESGALYQEYLENCSETDKDKLEQYSVDRLFFTGAIDFNELAEKGKYDDIVLVADYLMTLGHGTSYVFFDLIDVIRNKILGDNSFNGMMNPSIVDTAESEIKEYVYWMRKIAERLPEYARIIMDEMEHMESDRMWSEEEVEMRNIVENE